MCFNHINTALFYFTAFYFLSNNFMYFRHIIIIKDSITFLFN